jgi:tetratricopeptide (TPR) repeat protein
MKTHDCASITLCAVQAGYNPSNVQAFNDRGIAYYGKKDYDWGIADYNESIRLDPTNARAFCNLGRAKLRAKQASGNADIEKTRALNAFKLPMSSLLIKARRKWRGVGAAIYDAR